MQCKGTCTCKCNVCMLCLMHVWMQCNAMGCNVMWWNVCVWNIWRDVKLLTAAFTFHRLHVLYETWICWNFGLSGWRFMSFLFRHTAGGMRPSCKRMPTKLCMMVEAGADHPGVPALLWLPVVQGLLPFNFQCLMMGRGSTQGPPSRFCNFLHLSQSVKMGTIWLSWKGRVGFKLMSSSTDYDGDGSFLILLGSFHRPIPVRYNWSVFARKMRSTTQLAMIVLSKCVYVCTHTQSRLFISLCADWYVIPASGCRAGGEMGTTRFLDANQTGPWHATIWESGNGPYWAMIATENGPFVDRLPESLRRTHMIFHSKLLKYQRVCWTLAQSNHYMILIHVKCGIIKMHPNSPSCSGCYQDGPP